MNYFMKSPKTIRVCLVEDDHLIREGFATLIANTTGYSIVNTYSNCEDALRGIQKDQPDVVLMDIELPGMNGIEGTSRIKRIRPQTQIIVVTVYEND